METVASGPVVTIIGVTTVFIALAMLIGVLNVVTWILDRQKAAAGEPTAAPMPSADVAAADTAGDSSSDDELLLVALAAYGLHQRRRVSVRTQQPTASRWALAGRAQELRRVERR